MPKDESIYLEHMLENAQSASHKVRGKTREQFDADENLRLALVHLIQVIGEAARRVPDATRKAHPEIPWSSIVGMRHKVVHDYMRVDYDVVWQVATKDLPDLVRELKKIAPAAR